jgi:phospholipase C
VSWIVAPQKFSDHPSSAWYGAWYISEVMDILTQNPDVWKKTIFILTYDENDGYFDHIPPFTPPHPDKKDTGAVSKGMDTSLEYVADESQQSSPKQYARISPIGLGYRVPMVIASPWSRGGWVNSQVFDHTSSLQFLEKFLSKKTRKKIAEPNISEWRRTVCGDLTSVFRPYNGEDKPALKFLERDEFVEAIHRAQFKNPPANFKRVNDDDIEKLKADPAKSAVLPEQEMGTRHANALPYELYADGNLSADKSRFILRLSAGTKIHGARSAGGAFNVYSGVKFKGEALRSWSYAVKAGDVLEDGFTLSDFENGQYHLKVYGANGFYREFKGSAGNVNVTVKAGFFKGTLRLALSNETQKDEKIHIKDNAYGAPEFNVSVPAKKTVFSYIDVHKSHGWYDISVHAGPCIHRFAGRVENGKAGRTDPLMGREI